jgi:hypothetical protein
MKLSFDVQSTYDHFFPLINHFACIVVMDDAHCTIFEQVELAMTTSIKVLKPILVVKILTCCRIWWGKRFETFLYTCVSLSKTIIAMVF